MGKEKEKSGYNASRRFRKDAASAELRFEFGQNWLKFLAAIDEGAIKESRESLVKSLGHSDLAGRSFLDVGCGSGLFSLAARNLGATVLSFDFDMDSVRCTDSLKATHFPDDAKWTILRGSILDTDFAKELGHFDVVYAWGVLHHTGKMWPAIQAASSLVRVGGDLIIAIYNDQGHWSRIWLRVKQTYNRLPRLLRPLFVFLVMLPRELRSLAFSTITLQPSRYLRSWTHYRQNRGMSKWNDLVDWVGGLPFEVAKPEQIIFFLKNQGFDLRGLATCAGEIGCNEFVFRRVRD